QAPPRRATGESIPAVQAEPQPRRATGESMPAVQAEPAPRRATGDAIPAVRKPAPAYVPPVEDVDDDEDGDESASQRKKPAAKSAKATRARVMFLGMLVAFPVILGTYYTVGQMRARRNHEIKKHLSDAEAQLKHDSFESYKKACATAEKALELDPDSGKAHALLAYAYAIRWGEHSGDSARKPAEEHLEAALKSGELSSYTVAAQALTKTYSGKGQEALKELEEKVKKLESENRSSSLVYLTLGMAQTNLGDLERARESLEKAQALAPDDSRVYAALGALYRRRGQDSLATKNYEQALRYEKTHPESLLGAALMLLDQDNPKLATASKMLKALLDSDPPPSPRQLATAQLERSLLISRVALALPDLTPEAQKKLSDDTGVPADKSRAQAEVAKAEETGFTLDRQNPELHLIKGRRLLLEGNVDAASSAIREAIKMDGSRAHFYAELARVLMQKPGGEKDARDALLTAIKTMGQSPKLLVLLGHSYRKMGKLDDAIAQYTQAVSDPKTRNPEARLALGVALREKGDNDKAQQALEKAGQEYVGQASKIAAVQTELGRVFEAKGDRTKADEAYTKALNSDPEYGPVYYFYAKFLSGKDNSKAKTFAQEYLNREPRGEYAEATKSLVQ
ncbi:MAG TPA: tetratricopeptide repeat protein, partial [Myxococcaceae bacterium]|nr:tetratricopeptide repeat protein [Myxococcaceae bacterium]